jgi:hypothetical protein
MRQVAETLAQWRADPAGRPRRLSVAWLLVLAKNALLLPVVLLHGLRRALPPY